MFGHCYVATEGLYHLLQSSEYFPHCARDEDGIVHWWLEDGTGIRIDATREQYDLEKKLPPYAKGKKKWFLTKNPYFTNISFCIVVNPSACALTKYIPLDTSEASQVSL